MQQKEVFFLNKQKEKLSGVLHLPNKKTKKAVIVCHGFGANKNSLWIPKLCHALAKEGYCALRFDFAGNGKSEGEFSESDCEKEKQDLSFAIKFMREKKYSTIATIGHSMGGTVALMNTANNAHEIKAVIAIAAAIHTKKVEDKILTPKEKKELHTKGQIRIHTGDTHHTLKKSFFCAFEKQKVLKGVQKIKAPILLIHGSEDHTIPLQESESAKKEVPRLKLTVIDGGSHTLMRGESANILIKTATTWLKANF